MCFKTCLWGRLRWCHSRLMPASHSSPWLEFRTWLFSCCLCVLLGFLLTVVSPRGPPTSGAIFRSCCSRWVPRLLSRSYRGYRLLNLFAVQHPGATWIPVGINHAFGTDARKGYELKGSLQTVSIPSSMAGLPTCRSQSCQ